MVVGVPSRRTSSSSRTTALLQPPHMTATDEDRRTNDDDDDGYGDENDNILEDAAGHVNRDLAERIWNWEQERRRERDLPKVEYSVRAGLRLLDATVDAILEGRRSSSSSPRGGGTRSNGNSSGDGNLHGELIQEGLFALLDCMGNYRGEEKHEEDFETYAGRELYQHLARSLDADVRPIRLPKNVKAVVKDANRLMAAGGEDGTKLTLAQVASKLNIPVGRLQDYLRLAKATGHALSMESTVEILNPMLDESAPAYRDQDEFERREGLLLDDGRAAHRDELVDGYVDESSQREGDDEAWVRDERIIAAPLQDMIVDPDEPSPDELALEEQERRDLAAFLSSTLEPPVLEVVRLYFGLDSGKALTVQETAQELGKTDKQVLDLLKEGLGELRTAYFDPKTENGV